MLVEFTINNKTHSATKMSLFMVNYGRELRMGVDIKRKEKVKKITEFAEIMKKIQKETKVVLRKVQIDRGRKEVKEWEKRDKVL